MVLVNLSSICFEGQQGQHAGPSLFTFTLYVGVNDQIKTDPEKWAPSAVNCSNSLVSLYISLNGELKKK